MISAAPEPAPLAPVPAFLTDAPAEPAPPRLIAPPLVAFGLGLYCLAFPNIAARPGLLLPFVLLSALVLLVNAWFDDEVPQPIWSQGR